MLTGRNLFIVVAGVILTCACSTKPNNDIKNAEWLIGTWVNKTSEGSIYETWTKKKENEYSGNSYMVKEKDTVVFETIRLVQEPGGIFYIPTVKDQNDGLPVRFASKISTDTALVFENLQHDFPQMIMYTKITNDSLVAEISGIENGQENRQTFSMRRMNTDYNKQDK